MSECRCSCHLMPYPMCPSSSTQADKLSALLTQTEAMLTIQSGKLKRAHELIVDGTGHDPVAAVIALGNEVILLDNIVTQLRAAGVIPK